jgi:hypothetical protein
MCCGVRQVEVMKIVPSSPKVVRGTVGHGGFKTVADGLEAYALAVDKSPLSSVGLFHDSCWTRMKSNCMISVTKILITIGRGRFFSAMEVQELPARG